MKYVLVFSFIFIATTVWAKDVKDFNEVLIEDVKKDINTDNDEQFKVKQDVGRGPASVSPDWAPESDSKIDKNVRQIGPNEW